MRIAHPLLSSAIEMKEGINNVLVIENAAQLTRFVYELMAQINNAEGNFIFSKEYRVFEPYKNVEILTDLFSLEINTRSVLTKLASELTNLSLDENFYVLQNRIMSEVNSFLIDLEGECRYPLEIDEIDVAKLIKVANPKINMHSESLLEKIIDYIDIYQNYMKIKCFVILNAKSFLSYEELEMLYSTINYRKYNVLFLESQLKDVERGKTENIIIIDNDLCEIRIPLDNL